MSRYVVRVVGQSGMERYLCRGREVLLPESATRYPHPSNAWQAAYAYMIKHDKVSVDVIDMRDPERQV